MTDRDLPAQGDFAGSEAEALRAAMDDVRDASRAAADALSGGLRRALIDGRSLEQVLRSAALALSGRALSAALAPLERGFAQGVSGLFGGLFAAAVGGARPVMPFAKGGVVAAPGYFPLPGSHGGTGLMGEAGAEAVLPLARDANGRLGVAGGGAGAPQIVFNVETRDAESFARSEAQIATMVARAVGRGRRGL
jgi:phage-related minor tail protein